MTVTRRFLLTRGLAAAAGAAALSPGVLPAAAQAAAAAARPAGPGPPALPDVAAVPVPLSAWEGDLESAVSPLRDALRMPFTLGVASGEPAPDGFVLWTRLAPEPLAPDGRGGMAKRPVDVEWQVAEDADFRRVVRSGTATAQPAAAHTVHVEVRGLAAGRDYHYRFRSRGHVSPAGRTRTAPHPDARGSVRFVVTSCAHWEHGWFTAYRHIATSRPDLVLNLGDYLYEGTARTYASPSGLVREHAGPGRASTLAAYRLRHAQYKTDPDLQAAHAAAPWAVTFDDHEILNNWAGEHAARPEDQKRFPRIRAAAMQAYFEHMPLRRGSRPTGGHMQIFRRLDWGRVASFHVLDTRQYRDDQACGDGVWAYCPPRHDPVRTLLGARQEAWLSAGLQRRQAAWDVLAQQVCFTPNWRSGIPRGVEGHTVSGYQLDSWDGYPAARDRLLRSVAEARTPNFVVLTGDVHSHWAGEILHSLGDVRPGPLGVELVTSSITSGGDQTPETEWGLAAQRSQPYLRFFDQRRGWIEVTCSMTQMRADFHVLDYVSRPGSPARRAASFVVEDGSARLSPS